MSLNFSFMENIKAYLQQWKERYKNDLVTNIMPFWLTNGWDKVNGGCYTNLNRDGTVYDTTKSVWFQGRFAFTCAYAYNTIEKNNEWLKASKSTIDFIEQHCFDSDGQMFFEVTATGKPLRKRRYVFSETFAAIAMSEYALASGDQKYAKKALDLFNQLLQFSKTPGILTPKYHPSVQLKGHSITMILINTASQIRAAIQDPVLTQQIDESIASIQNNFMHPEFKAVLETVDVNGGFINTAMGRTINPGHSIETAWFILEEAKKRNWDKNLVKTGTTIFDWSWEWGWDKEHGGISNFKDCMNYPHQDYSHDMKFWWPQVETIIGSLYAYYATGDPKYIDIHKLISDYTYTHFPDKEYGEWYGYLHYNGTVSQPAKGNLFKGPFHIPRMMIKSYELCSEILQKI